MVRLAQSSLQRQKGEQWASIQDASIKVSPEHAKLDDTLAFTVGFKLNGGIRRNFVRRLWEAAYDEHDLGLRVAYRVDLTKQRTKPLPGSELKRDKFVRRGVFFWTRNPELPYRVWATIATEFETILYPKTEEEAQTMLFDVTRTFELPASKLGSGKHELAANVHAKWGKHIFTERGEASAKTHPLKVSVE
ncbi:MAG TPA: hypothetical protein VFJ63_00420 [Candidatus Bathyarchaeia archaeon]|nr:hypothetical protein [Candidatus Bathyarchaeia archaeon]